MSLGRKAARLATAAGTAVMAAALLASAPAHAATGHTGGTVTPQMKCHPDGCNG